MSARSSAGRYARALFDVTVNEHADLDAVQADLAGFAAMVAGHEALHRALLNPAVPASKKRAVVESLVQQSPGFSPILSKLLLLLAERDRLSLLPDLAVAFDERLMDARHVVRAELTTAVELPADRLAALKEGLARATGREVLIESRVDPELVGGAVARIGSTIYDGSVTTQLEKLKQSLLESTR